MSNYKTLPDTGFVRLASIIAPSGPINASRTGRASQKSELIESKQKRIAELESELAATTGAPPVPEPATTQSVIEQQNMLKTIFGMAVRGYSYNPADKRSKTVSEIVSDSELEGIPLSDDTIRRYLKEARDLLNEWQQQAG